MGQLSSVMLNDDHPRSPKRRQNAIGSSGGGAKQDVAERVVGVVGSLGGCVRMNASRPADEQRRRDPEAVDVRPRSSRVANVSRRTSVPFRSALLHSASFPEMWNIGYGE